LRHIFYNILATFSFPLSHGCKKIMIFATGLLKRDWRRMKCSNFQKPPRTVKKCIVLILWLSYSVNDFWVTSTMCSHLINNRNALKPRGALAIQIPKFLNLPGTCDLRIGYKINITLRAWGPRYYLWIYQEQYSRKLFNFAKRSFNFANRSFKFNFAKRDQIAKSKLSIEFVIII